MPEVTRLHDLTVGVCSHGLPCCPHGCTGVHITGSPDTDANDRLVTRIGDFSAHTCPHCGVNMNVEGSPDVDANGIPVTRKGDGETEFCGSGVSVTGSPDVYAN
jgi:uncharacterized Zn-binding protein involved in type VI secretion